ncbi:DUF1919 domain-containing protein [Flavobacterium commune]|uniref:Uncharacterized protein n=1 Tax=Flavobacterium commune TaxID=1306519 RepID=A0A1D9P7I1_9FLAO|nr:DUF1919 domain-containing protein [Flavobacterium commune]AOZ98541.1 hypothetical protein BIW12_03330 [Flavobacterium commune]
MLQLIRKPIRKLFLSYNQRRMSNVPFVIISDNCWGAEIYKEFNRPYNTPFVGLFFHSPCFIRLLEDFNYYMEQPLHFVSKTKYPISEPNYPIALLGKDVEVHFLHYKDEAEATAKWLRRLERMKQNSEWNNYYFKFSVETDKTEEVKDLLDRFYSLAFKNKLSFATSAYQSANHILIKEDKLPDGLSLYSISRILFDVEYWLINGKIKNTFWNTLVKRI